MVLKVFLSSTSKDLDPFRKAVDTAIHRLKDLHCVRMETGLRGRIRRARSARRRCGRASSSSASSATATAPGPPDDERSFTEIEYDTAVAEGLPRLMFVAPDDFPTAANVLRAETADDARRQEGSEHGC